MAAMRACTVVVLLGLAAVGAQGSTGLLDVLGLEPEAIIGLAGIELPSGDKTGEDDPAPCGISPSKAAEDAYERCLEQETGGDNQELKGKEKGRRRGGRGRNVENAVQNCIFKTLELVDEEGIPIQDEIVKLIDSYTGDSEDKQVMKRMAEKCMATISKAPANRKANALMMCVKKGMRNVCRVHDLKKKNPNLALMVAKKSTEKCMEGIQLPPKMIWSKVRCAAEQMQKFATARLATLKPTKARKRRSPQDGKRKGRRGPGGKQNPMESKESTETKETMEEEASEGRSPRGGSRKGPGGSRGKQDSMESTETMDTKESMEDADSEERVERRKKMMAKGKEMMNMDMEEAREKLEKVVGPLDEALQAAGEALKETERCTYAAAGVLNDNNNVDGEKMLALLSEATGTGKVKEALLAAAEACSTQESDTTSYMECLNSELMMSCPADRRQKKGGGRRGKGGNRRRQAARAGRPANVARPKMPAALKQRSQI